MGVLARQNLRAYSSPASATAWVGRRKPVESNWRIRAIVSALFLRLHPLDGERCGATFGLAGVQLGRFLTPVSFAAIAVRSDLANSKVFLTGVCHHV